MAVLTWDDIGERLYETGVDRGVLYLPDPGTGLYDEAHVWNGLVTVTETPSGAEANAQFADNIKYLNLLSAEEFGATIEAFTYPTAFNECDGIGSPQAGVLVGQQGRRSFGLVYRTKIGNDLEGTDHGYKLHLLYGLLASPSEKAYTTINDSPEAITFSWEVASTPAPAGDDFSPTSLIVIDSTLVDSDDLATLEDMLFGTVGDDASLPTPEEVFAIFGAGIIEIDMGDPDNHPTFNQGTNVITLPVSTNFTWYKNGVVAADGAQPALTVGQTANIKAVANPGYYLSGNDEWDFDYEV